MALAVQEAATELGETANVLPVMWVGPGRTVRNVIPRTLGAPVQARLPATLQMGRAVREVATEQRATENVRLAMRPTSVKTAQAQ